MHFLLVVLLAGRSGRGDDLEQARIGRDDLDATSDAVLVAKAEDLLLNLQRLVVGELNQWGNWLEDRLVDGDLRLLVNGVVADVQKLDNFGLLVEVFENVAGKLPL